MTKFELPRTPDGEIDWKECVAVIRSPYWPLEGAPPSRQAVIRAIHEDGQRVGQEGMRERVLCVIDSFVLVGVVKRFATSVADRIRELKVEP